MNIEAIEMRLMAMNGDALHRLGDHYLFFEGGKDYESINPVGQSEGKQKSTKGTPDTRITLKNGKHIFIQYTTQKNCPEKKAFYNKLVTDLEACFDPKKTSISCKDIEYVVLFFNSNLNEETEQKLKDLTKSYGVPLKLYNLTTIAHNIYKYYPYLAKDYLGIAIGTYQILPLEQFVSEYEKGGIATPLSNPFYHRENEIKAIKSLVEANMITIINGKSGVGKSKVAIEIMKRFRHDHPDYSCFCISNKDLPIINDLRNHLGTAKNTLLFIDDVNKSIHLLREIFTWFTERDVQLKIVVTVREYVYKQIYPSLKEYSNNTYYLPDFNEYEILKIISSEPFNIVDSAYQKKIIQLSKGNARLAIMAAIACKDKQLVVLDSVINIYNEYYKRVSGDSPVLKQPEYLKVLGILSFFRTIDSDNREDSEKIFSAFNIDENQFWTKIYALETYEIVDVFSDKTTAKFTDQILEGYLFYKVFLEDKLVSYRVILDQFFPSYSGRIKFTAIEGQNTFGKIDFENKLLPYVQEKFDSIIRHGESEFDFLKIFYSYLPDETLNYLYKTIQCLPTEEPLVLLNEVENSNAAQKAFIFEGGKKIERYHHDSFFELISEFLKDFNPNFTLSLSLMFDYIEKKQDVAELFIELISGYIAFSADDERLGFEKENFFSIELASRVATGHPIHIYIFLRLAPNFLKTTFFHHVNYHGAKVGKVSYALIEKVITIRAIYWTTFSNIFNNYRLLSLYTLDNIKNGLSQNDHHLLRASDWEALATLFDRHFDPKNFIDTFTINKLIIDLTRGGKTTKYYSEYLKKVDTEEYRWFKVLDYSIVRNREIVREEYENHNDFRTRFNFLKAEEILSNFNYDTSAQYLPLFDLMGDCVTHNIWEFYHPKDAALVLLSNILKYEKMFLELFAVLVTKPYFNQIIDLNTFFITVQQTAPNLLDKVEAIIFSGDFKISQYTRIEFFNSLYQSNITNERCQSYKRTFDKIEGTFYLTFKNAYLYCAVDPSFLQHVITTLIDKAERKNITLSLDSDFIEKKFSILNSIETAENLYLCLSSDRYDYEGHELSFILKLKPEFLERYIQSISSKSWYERDQYNELTCLWQLPNYLSNIAMVFDHIVPKPSYLFAGERILDHLIEFTADEVDTNKKISFFKYYICLNNRDAKKMNASFKIIQNKYQANFKSLFRHFLEHNQDITLFRKINWTDQGTIIRNGNSILGEINERIWTQIKFVVEEMNPKIEFLEHKIYINSEIDYCRKSAVSERKHDFLGRG
ncbi:hypothetical protein FMM05_00255 [Flavobacterium zepuense]|uniref:Novel STAND NTPase 3 domain-containing protein n=1 Tax=Flavobacterium zepuense TaxID=2593302 RepID=A0A552V9H6_9FLAO|nr:hypothetical protein [Flavobacterium zepuense]TRW27118.1 hypothetical protein FMM05_00255 [Flavobacterium zepuense]